MLFTSSYPWGWNFSLYNIHSLGNSPILQHHLYRSDESWLFINYFTIFWECTMVIIDLFNLWQLKHTHISNILVDLWAFWRNYPMCWHHSLTLRHATKDSHLCTQVLSIFSTIMVSFLTYLFILHLIKYLWSFGYHWHLFFMPTFEVKTQTRFVVLFTSGSLIK